MFKILFFTIMALALAGCNKPDPAPENKDPIYQDLQSQLQITQKNLADVQKSLDEHKKNLEKVKPQTGQIKYAEKRVWDTQKTLDSLIQQEKYWKIRILERRKYARIEYMKAYNKKESWPNPSEFNEYMVEKRLRQAKQSWDARDRLNDYKKANPSAGTDPKNTTGAKSSASKSSH